MAGVFDILPGYLKMPEPDGHGFRDVPEAHHAEASKPRDGTRSTTGPTRRSSRCRFSRRCMATPRRRKTTGRFTICPRSTATTPGRRSGTTCTAGNQRPVRLRHERRRDRPELAEEHRRAEESRLAGRLRDLSRRDQRVLASARHHAGGDEADQHDGLPPARRRLRRKGRHLRQLGALAAVEERRRCRRPGNAKLDQEILARSS